MKITKIKINNFRSIKEAIITPSSFNVFVGQNNHGKTNFFEAIDWFYSGKGDLEKIRHGRVGDDEISVVIEFTDIQDGVLKMKSEKNQSAIKKRFGDFDTMEVKRSSLLPKVRQIFDQKNGKWEEKNPAGFDNAFNDFLPSFEYVSTAIRPMDMTKYGKTTPIGTMLAGVLSVILENDPEYAKFRAQFDLIFTNPSSQLRIELDKLSGKVKVYLEKQFADCEQVVFEVSQPVFEDILKNFETSIDDGVYTSAEEKGDGMQRALMLAIIQAYADFRRENSESSKFFLFFIDEAELHLHPAAQRKLKNALLDLASNGDQVFINTHSSVLISEDQDLQQIYRVEKSNKMTGISAIASSEKHQIIYELLGGSPSDLLLPNNFLIAEGASEYEFLTRIISRHYRDQKKIQVVYAEGDHEAQRRSMNGINKVYITLTLNPVYKEKLVIMCDTPHPDKQTDFNNFTSAYSALIPNGQLLIIPKQSLEEYYPAPWTTSAPSSKVDLARRVGNEISKEQFENEMPVVYLALQNCWNNAY